MDKVITHRKIRNGYIIGGIILVLLLMMGIFGMQYLPAIKSLVFPNAILSQSPSYRKPVAERTVADWIVIGAKEEVAKRVKYDASYQQIDYPNGDVEPNVGACTDVVIRALRKVGVDLQQRIYEDRKAHMILYPAVAGVTKPDPNIDHRRVASQIVYFQRFGLVLPVQYTSETKHTWQPGDVVCWRMPTGRLHTGILSDRMNRRGVPLVIHNAFRTIEDDALLRWTVIGHFRWVER